MGLSMNSFVGVGGAGIERTTEQRMQDRGERSANELHRCHGGAQLPIIPLKPAPSAHLRRVRR